jgi:inhibitor of KinA
MNNKKILFVYGTLKRREFNDVSRYNPAPTYLGDGWVRGRLYDLGHCPTMTADSRGGPVWGEVFELDAALFDALDRYEAMCGDYVLEHVTVQMGDRTIEACVYVSGPRQAGEGVLLPDGRWPRADGAQADAARKLRTCSVRCAIPAPVRNHVIDVCYAIEFGPDLPVLAAKAGISVEAFINLHLAQSFTVAQEGFLPGFVTLDGMPHELRFARRGVPRPRVAAGTVGVFDNLCGLYPKDGPGSWNLIGRAPDMPLSARAMRPGDVVSFRRVSMDKA